MWTTAGACSAVHHTTSKGKIEFRYFFHSKRLGPKLRAVCRLMIRWRAWQKPQRTATKKAIQEAKERFKEKAKLWKDTKVKAVANCNGCGTHSMYLFNGTCGVQQRSYDLLPQSIQKRKVWITHYWSISLFRTCHKAMAKPFLLLL